MRITLRIPRDIHQRLNDAAAGKKSMNAEIIARLESSFVNGEAEKLALVPQETIQLLTDLRDLLSKDPRLATDLADSIYGAKSPK
jgi:hypothetical protein